MRLIKFEVENYKNFSKKFTLDLSDVKNYKFNEACISDGVIRESVIYGKNSVGKTNFTFALMDIITHLTDKMRFENDRYYLNADSIKKRAIFVYTFKENDDIIKYKYEKNATSKLCYEELLINGKELFNYDFLHNKGNVKELETIEGAENLNWEFKDIEMSIIRYIANNTPISKKHPIKQILQFATKMLWFRSIESNKYIGYSIVREDILEYIIKNDYVKEFEKFLQEYGVDVKVEVHTTVDGRKSIFFKHKTLLPFGTASSGTKALTTFFYWLKQSQDMSLMVIDEFDAFYHFELAEKIINALKNKLKVQVILTSHNTGLLSNKIMRPDCYFILTKDGICSLANATKRELREGHNLEKLFVSGEFDEQ
jgi:hypothetical protein